MTNLFFTVLLTLVSPTAQTNAPSWLQSGQFNGWWNASICRTVDISFPVTNGNYQVQWTQQLDWPWVNVTQRLDGFGTNRITVRLAVPQVEGFLRAVKMQ